MLTNLFVGIPYLLTKGFLLGPSLWLWKRWMKLYSCECAHWLRVCWGWWWCSLPALSSCLPIPFCSNLRQDPARGRRRWRTAAAPILCLSITVPLRCLGSRAMLTVSGPGHNIVISDNSPETTSHLLPQLHSHYIYNSSRTRHTLSVILNRSGP